MDILQEKRKAIDLIDDKIISLFNERMKIVKEIGEIKKESGVSVLNKNRENEILSRIESAVSDEIKPYATSLFETLMSLSRNYQSKK